MNSTVTLRPAGMADRAATCALLEQCALPTSDLPDNDGVSFWLAETTEGIPSLVGVIGLERAGAFGLLRSLAIAPSARGQGLARRLVVASESAARADGLRALYLIAMDDNAARCLAHLGYSPIERDYVPPALRTLPEFAGLCPASNPCLRKILDPTFVETAIAVTQAATTNSCGCRCGTAPASDVC